MVLSSATSVGDLGYGDWGIAESVSDDELEFGEGGLCVYSRASRAGELRAQILFS